MSALFWKEYREVRSLVGLGMLAAVIVIIVGMFAKDDDGSLTVMFTIYAGWPLLAALCGAGAFANEVEGGTLSFLLSLPVARGKVWWTKFVSGLFALLVLMAGSMLLNFLLLPLRPMPMKTDMLETDVIILWLAVSLTVFAATFFFSALIGRALVAALAGLAFTGAMAGLCAATLMFLDDWTQGWGRRGVVSQRPDVAMLVQFLAVMGLLLFASRVTFMRGELLLSSRRFKVGLTTLVAPPLLIAALIAVPFYRSLTTLPVAKIESIEKIEVSPQHDRVALLVQGATVWSRRQHAWVIDANTGRSVDLGAALDITWSRDGERLACATLRGFLGIPRKNPMLVWMDTSGAMRQKVRDGGWFIYSPRSDTFRIQVAEREKLVVVVLDSNGKKIASVPYQSIQPWHPDGRSYYEVRENAVQRCYLDGKRVSIARCPLLPNAPSGCSADLSPDGKWLTVGCRNEPTAFYLIATDGSGWRVVREGKVSGHSWSPDSRYLFVRVPLPKKEGNKAEVRQPGGVSHRTQQQPKNKLVVYDTAAQTWRTPDEVPWTRGLNEKERWRATSFWGAKVSPDRKRLAWMESESTAQGRVMRFGLIVFDVQQTKKQRLSWSATEPGMGGPNAYSWNNSLEWLDNDRMVVALGKRAWVVDLKNSSQRQLFPPL